MRILKKLEINYNDENTNIIEDNKEFNAVSKYHSNLFSYYKFQPEAVKYLVERDKAILALPTGTGKTAVSLSVFAKLKEQNKNLKLIFVTEKSVVKQALKTLDDFFTLKGDKIYGDYKTTRLKIYKDFRDNLDALFINYAMMRTDVEEFQDLFEEIRPENILLICDEANNVAGNTSIINKIVFNMVKELKNTYFLTATVSKGKLEDYYNIIKCLGKAKQNNYDFISLFGNYEIQVIGMAYYGGKRIGKTGIGIEYNKDIYVQIGIKEILKKGANRLKSKDGSPNKQIYNNTLTLKLKSEKWKTERAGYTSVEAEDEKGNIYKIRVGLKTIIKLTGYKNLNLFTKTYGNILYSKSKKEIAPDLPDFTKQLYYVDEDKITHKAMCELYKILDYEPKQSQINIALTYPQYLNQYDVNIDKEHQNEKIKQLLYIIQENLAEDEKAIIYHTSRQVIDFVYDLLIKKGYTCSKITGDVVKERENEKLNFINKNQFMLINDAAGVGADGLQVSGNLIFLGLPTTGGQLQQICGRISRINTKHNKLTLHFILTENTFDEDKYITLMSQLRLMSILDKNSVDNGLLDSSVTDGKTVEESDIFIKEQIWSRRNQYK